MLWFFSLTAPGTAGLNYSGALTGQEQQSGGIIYSQDHNVGLQLSQVLTTFASISEQGRYSYVQNQQEDVRETLSRSFDLVDKNQLFRVNLSGYATSRRADGREQSESRALDAGFRSDWENDFYPSLHFGFGKTTEQLTNRADLPVQETGHFDTSLEWERSNLALYYNYRYSDADYGVGYASQINGAHSGSLKFSDTYWQNKFRVRFEQLFTQNSREFYGLGAGFQLPIFITDVSTGHDDSPADNLEDPAVVNNNLMRDSDLLTPAYPVAAGSTFNNIVLVSNNQVITKINLYTNPGFSSDPGLIWALYSTELLGTGWELVSTAITGVIYDVSAQRFEITLAPVAAKYLKISLAYPALTGPDVVFTEVEVFNVFDSAVAAAPREERISNSTLLSLSTVLSKNFRLGYVAENNDSGLKGNTANNNRELSQQVNLAYDSLEKSRANSSLFLSEQAELETRRYFLGFHHEFLPTLSVALSWSKSESYLASLLATESAIYRLDTTAQLYPDLDMTVGFTLSNSGFFQDNLWSERQGDSLLFQLTARLDPGTTLNLSETISEQKTPGSATTRSSVTTVSFTSRISEAVALSGQGGYSTQSPAQADSFTFRTSLNIALNKQTSLSATYAYNYQAIASPTATPGGESDTTQSGAIDLRWTPKSGLVFEGGTTYQAQVDPAEKEFLTYGKVRVSFMVP